MKKHKSTAFCWLVLFSLLFACGNNAEKDNKKERITIAVAANMQFAMEELSTAFSQKTGIKCNLSVSSSGKLTAQIKQGAPFDIFVSANMKYPNEVFKSDLAAAPPKVYAYGKLVLWSMKEGLQPSLDLLTNETVTHIALANPMVAPYGVAALEVLKNNQLHELVKKKLVYGESIAQTNQFIITKSAETGFTAMSVVLSPKMKEKGRWIAIDTSFYTPIEQGVVIIKKADLPTDKAQQFYDFLFSKEAQKILEEYGYAVN